MLVAAIIFNFVVLVVGVVVMAKTPFLQFLQVRSTSMKTQMVEATEMATQAEALLSEWQKNTQNFERHVEEVRSQAKAALQKYEQQISTNLKTEMERIKKEGQMAAKSEVNRAVSSLQAELVDKSIDTAESYLKSHLDDSDKKKLVDQYSEIVNHVS